ncbi:MAG: SEC-C domain-containing protein [Bacteriovoracaceae bacterium]|nr:SEC-C domain-containing protein [Bacteriovoracaceae bacterium]
MIEIDKTDKKQEGPEHVHGPNCNHSHNDIKPIVRQTPKIGRNEPCSCGSEKKFKKCCGKS